MNTLTRIIVGIAAQCMIAVPVCAQTVSLDPATGDHLITYSVDGTQFVARVLGPDRISPEISLLSVVDSAGKRVYSYSLTNAERAPATAGRGILLLSLPCSGEGGTSAPATPLPAGWQARSRMGIDDVPRCQFLAGRSAVLDPGESVEGLLVASSALPAIGKAYVYGLTGMTEMPTGEETPDTVHELVASLTRMGVAVSTVLPLRAAASVATGQAAAGVLKEDLAQVCGPLAWIDDRGICRSLQAKLDAAGSSLGRGQTNTAVNQLSAFQSELSAQRGKHVSETAYSLLNALAGHALSLLR